jgi:hypothetical protein
MMEYMMEIACPADEILADFLEGRLSEVEKSEMEQHLSDCDVCLEVLAVGNSLIRGENQFDLAPVPLEVTDAAARLAQGEHSPLYESLPERVERTLRDLPTKISGFFGDKGWGELQPQPVRALKREGSGDFVTLRKTFGDVDAEIELEKTGESKAHIRVRLLLDVTASQEIRVTLKKGDREIASQLAVGGYALFEDIPFGKYSFTFARDGLTLGTYFFEIKETRHDRR